MDKIIERILAEQIIRRSKKIRLELRRAVKTLLRWMTKHWGHLSQSLPCSTAKPLSLREYLENLVNLLTLIPIAKFCNGLIGVSLTDSLPAPAI